jgi:hypothetical protein
METTNLTPGKRAAPTFWIEKGYWPSSRPAVAHVRAKVIAMALRSAIQFGWVVVLVGPCRSGKTVLLERATPGNVIDKSQLVLRSAHTARAVFDLSDVPPSVFSIDEPRAFDPGSLLAALQTLRGRGFAIAFQHERELDESGMGDELRSKHRSLWVRLGPKWQHDIARTKGT